MLIFSIHHGCSQAAFFFFLLNIQCFKLQNAVLCTSSHLNLTGTFWGLAGGFTYCTDPMGFRSVHFWGCQAGLGGRYLPALVSTMPEQPLWGTPVCLHFVFACAMMCGKMGSPVGHHCFPTVQKKRWALGNTEIAEDRRVGWGSKPWLNSAHLTPTFHLSATHFQVGL